jgi:hypothetical protein
MRFLSDVIIPIVIISGISGTAALMLHNKFLGVFDLVISCAASVTIVCGLIYLVGLKREEKEFLKVAVQKIQFWNSNP